MPTGYTQELMEKGMSFREFALRCARNFGALIEMRDEPMDAPIPERFEVSPTYNETIAKLESDLLGISVMDDQAREALGQRLKEEAINNWEQVLIRENEQNKRLENMAREVSAWTSPSSDHDNLKEFMLQQLDVSAHDTQYIKVFMGNLDNKPAMEFFDEFKAQTEKDLASAKKRLSDEKFRVAQRNLWLQTLRDSLPK